MWRKATQPKILGTRLVEVLKFGKNVDKTCMGLLKSSTEEAYLLIICVVVKTTSP